jgi:hypothetical protein
VNHNPTRKQFFSKLVGVVAAAGAGSKLAAETSEPASAPPVKPARTARSAFELRHDGRAVARRDSI